MWPAASEVEFRDGVWAQVTFFFLGTLMKKIAWGWLDRHWRSKEAYSSKIRTSQTTQRQGQTKERLIDSREVRSIPQANCIINTLLNAHWRIPVFFAVNVPCWKTPFHWLLCKGGMQGWSTGSGHGSGPDVASRKPWRCHPLPSKKEQNASEGGNLPAIPPAPTWGMSVTRDRGRHLVTRWSTRARR